MALLYKGTVAGKHYEIRSAGYSLRLYTNGVFHSQFNARRAFMGHVWDLLALPAVMLKTAEPKILVLGLGGGAVIHQLKVVHPTSKITALELDKVHIQLARKYFKVPRAGVKLIHADAVSWIKANSESFDMIIDDLFGDDVEDPSQPSRAINADESWMSTLAAHLKPDGLLVMNLEQGMRKHQLREIVSEGASINSVLEQNLPQYQNGVTIFSKLALSGKEYRRACKSFLESQPYSTSRLPYRVIDKSAGLSG